jgi:hypothetical protein
MFVIVAIVTLHCLRLLDLPSHWSIIFTAVPRLAQYRFRTLGLNALPSPSLVLSRLYLIGYLSSSSTLVGEGAS